MIKKRESCLYCGEKMESKTAKRKFCSDKCKVYWHREKFTESKEESKYDSPPKPYTKNEDIYEPTKDALKKETIEIKQNEKWKEGDPKEGSTTFFLKFGAFKYDDDDFIRK